MTGFVTVTLRGACRAGGGVDVTLNWGWWSLVLTAAPCPAGRTAPAAGILDEHFAVDADTRTGRQWASCADVVASGLPRPQDEAWRRLERVRSDHPGAAVAAVALAGGGWAVAGARHPAGFTVGAGSGRALGADGGHHLLVPSCLHAYLVAGGSPARLAGADLCVTARPAPDRPPHHPSPDSSPDSGSGSSSSMRPRTRRASPGLVIS